MANPTATARQTPTGIYAKDGYRSLVTFGSIPALNIWEIEGGQPTGRTNGTPINITTMWNDDIETMAPNALNTLKPSSFKFAYDPGVQEDIKALVGRKDTRTQRFYDGTTHAEYGYVSDVDFDKLVRNQVPTGTMTWQPTGYDPTNNVEVDILVTNVTGS